MQNRKELEENIFLSGSPFPGSKFIRPCVLRSYCPYCGKQREIVVQNIEDLGEGLEEIQWSEFHQSGECKKKQSTSEFRQAADVKPAESKAEALVKLLTEIMIEAV